MSILKICRPRYVPNVHIGKYGPESLRFRLDLRVLSGKKFLSRGIFIMDQKIWL